MKNKYCDWCDEEWEETFFCKKCSNKYLGTDLVKTPKSIYYGVGEEMEMTEEDIFSGDVCFNCCRCHLK
jgi:hypothetical protein